MSETGDAMPASQSGDANEALDTSFWRKPGMILACADYDQPRVLHWLWPAHIPLGALSFFGGEDAWKDPFILDLIKRVTNGQDMPDGSPGLDGPVLVFLHSEYPHEIYPVLAAGGVDMRRVLALTGIPSAKTEVWPSLPIVETEDEDEHLYLPAATPVLEQAVRTFGFKMLVVVDLWRYFDEPYHWRNPRDVREALTPLARVARKLKLPVVIFQCDDSIFPGPGAPRVKWVGARDWTADELLEAQAHPRKARRNDLDTWLRDTLAEGPLPVRELVWRAEYEGWTIKQLYAAKARLGVFAGRKGFGRGGESVWSL